jgi:hypothetical protein
VLTLRSVLIACALLRDGTVSAGVCSRHRPVPVRPAPLRRWPAQAPRSASRPAVVRWVAASSHSQWPGTARPGGTSRCRQPVAEKWDGSRWTVTEAPSPGKHGDDLKAVSCTGPAFCLIVGTPPALAPLFGGPFADQRSGNRWQLEPFASVPGQALPDDVSCALPTRCMVVGEDLVSGAARPLTEEWTGSGWAQLPALAEAAVRCDSPPPGRGGSAIVGIVAGLPFGTRVVDVGPPGSRVHYSFFPCARFVGQHPPRSRKLRDRHRMASSRVGGHGDDR